MSSSSTKLWVWGSNSYGQLGVELSTDQSEVPIPIHLSFMVKDACLGGGHTLLLSETGDLYGVGRNDRGQLGLNQNVQVKKWTRIPYPSKFSISQIYSGWDFSFIIDEAGTVWATGSNSFGQLGLDDRSVTTVSTFTPIHGISDIVSIACGLRHTLFLNRDGIVFGTGCNKRLQLGPSASAKRIYSPERLKDFPENVRRISAGQNFSLCLSNHLAGFGDNKFNQLPPPKWDDHIADIQCGWTHTLILNGDDGIVEGWGRNTYHQLSGCTFKADKISSGSEHVLAERDGRLYSWGWNEHGNCGLGTITDVDVPTIVDTIRDEKLIFFRAGTGHSLAYTFN